ncbi:hypothetical protein M405DRAFT_810819 [Rhizopogon salebrosus TDB-379]|nr:hypothetical protein M405DRAFT_810819 [Rhizopogon salebrosus TDB-379]
MTDTNCRSLSCYICQKRESDMSKCQLWDELAKRHANEQQLRERPRRYNVRRRLRQKS